MLSRCYKLVPALVLMALVFTSCRQESQAPPPDVQKISALEAAGLLANDFAVLVDIREESEAAKGFRIEKAKAVPYSKIVANAPEWQEIAKTVQLNKQFIFVGGPDDKAAKLAQEYTKKGYNTDYIADIEEWKKAGLPIKK